VQHPLTRFFNYLKRIDFALALERDHINERDLTNWYPEWMYELMETDEVRNPPYRSVIQETVPGKVVLELGTGRKALWAVNCARAGAKKVYAIEANKNAYQSSLEFVQSQKIENVHLIYGFSDKVYLPERCDVLVHDLVGDIGSSEGMVPFIDDVRRRLLKPNAAHIPCRCTTYLVLVEDPRLRASEWAFSYVMREFKRFEGLRFVRFFGFPHSAVLSEPHVFEDVVFTQSPQLKTDKQFSIRIIRDGALRGACLFIRLYLSETAVVDTWTSSTTWSNPFVRLQEITTVKRGDAVEVHIESDLGGNPTYALKLQYRGKDIGGYAWSGD
jgi:hypothetical protein